MSILAVAKLANVSHATVSRVINNHPNVSEESRRLVRDAMRTLNYRPSARRRGPRPLGQAGMRTRNVALLFLGADVSLIHAPVFAATVHGIEVALAEQDLNLTLAQIPLMDRLPPIVTSGQLDGLLLIGQDPPEPIRQKLRRFATVWVGSRRSTQWGDHVHPDDLGAGEVAAQYLIGRGHRHLAFANIEPNHPGFVRRAAAFEATARQAGATVASVLGPARSPSRLLQAYADEAACTEVVDRLLALNPRPTGVFIPADLQTVILQRLLIRRGVRPGTDITLISCNHEQALLAALDPRPATIDIRSELLGKRAVDQLLYRMRNPSEPGPVIVTIQPVLVEAARESPAAEPHP